MLKFKKYFDLKTTSVLAVALLSAAALTACGTNTETPPVDQTPPSEVESPSNETPAGLSEAEQQQILDAFKQSIAENPGIEGMDELAVILTDQIESLSPEYTERLLSLFETAQIKALEQDERYGGVSDGLAAKLYENKIFAKADLTKLMDDPQSIGDAALIEEIERYKNAFYTIETQEGMYYLVVDYNKYLTYQSQVSEWYSEYLELMARELSAKTFSDAAMVIPLDEMWERVTAAESQLSRVQNETLSVELEDAHQRLQQYFVMMMNALVYGGNNTPVYAYDTNAMSEARIAFYESHAFDPESPIFNAFEAFKQIAREEGYKQSDRVNVARTAIFDAVEEAYLK
jgi:hypothetical protein